MSKFLRAFLITCFFSILIGCTSSVESPPATEEQIQEVDPIDNSAETDPIDIPEDTVELTPVRIGVNTNTIYPLVMINGDIYEGFEIDIAKEIVQRVYGENFPIQWVPITSAERFSSLAEGQIDFLIRNLTHSKSREDSALFSGGYFLSGNGFLTMEDAEFEAPSDLDGLKIALPGYLQDSLDSLAANLGVDLLKNAIANNEDFIKVLKTDEVQAIFHDWVFLFTIKEDDSQIIFLDDTSLSPFGIAFPLHATELRDQVDNALNEIISDGTYLSLFGNWFAMDIPWNIDEMFEYPPRN